MASPIYLASLQLPLTEKPVMAFSAEQQLIYQDIFNLQNTFKIVLANFTEEAPDDGNSYVRQNKEWVVGGGGGGGIPEAPNDGKIYGRSDEGWVEVTGSGGGSGTPSYISYPETLPASISASTSAIAGKGLVFRALEEYTITEVGGFVLPESSADSRYRVGLFELDSVTIIRDVVDAATASSIPAVESAVIVVPPNTRVQRIKGTLSTPVVVEPGKYYVAYLNRVEAPTTVCSPYFISTTSAVSIWQPTFNATYYQGTPRWTANVPPFGTPITCGIDQYLIFVGGFKCPT